LQFLSKCDIQYTVIRSLFMTTTTTTISSPENPDLAEIRKLATYSTFSKASALLGDVSFEKWLDALKHIYQEEVAILLDCFYPPYQPPTLVERFKRWLGSYFW